MLSNAVKEALKKERKKKKPFVIPKKTKSKTKKTKKTKTLTKYEVCKKNIIGQDMRLFKQGKLKQRNKQPVKTRKQAIAIALSWLKKSKIEKFEY